MSWSTVGRFAVPAAVKEHVHRTDTVPTDRVVPNDWNPNKMDEESFAKLDRGIVKLRKEAGSIPPVVVRPHPTQAGYWQIIDGEHRWRVFRAHDWPEIDVVVLDVGDATAQELTGNLNYLRGRAAPDAYARYVATLIETAGTNVEGIAQILPETASELHYILDASGIQPVEVQLEAPPRDDDVDTLADALVEERFALTRAQAEVVELQLARCASPLRGKGVRGRSLELMARACAQLSDTELETLAEAGDPAEDAGARGRGRGTVRIEDVDLDEKPRKKRR